MAPRALAFRAAMPAYGETLQPRELWDIAFSVMTLRDGVRRRGAPPVEIVPLSLKGDRRTVRRGASRAAAHVVRVPRLRELDYTTAPAAWTGGALASAPSAPTQTTAPSVCEAAGANFPSARRGGHLSDRRGRVRLTAGRRAGIPAAERSAPRRLDGGGSRGHPLSGPPPGRVGNRLFRRRRRRSVPDDVCGRGCTARASPASGRRSTSKLREHSLPRAPVWWGSSRRSTSGGARHRRPGSVRPARLGDSDTVRIGHWAIAVGDPPGPQKSLRAGNDRRPVRNRSAIRSTGRRPCFNRRPPRWRPEVRRR